MFIGGSGEWDLWARTNKYIRLTNLRLVSPAIGIMNTTFPEDLLNQTIIFLNVAIELNEKTRLLREKIRISVKQKRPLSITVIWTRLYLRQARLLVLIVIVP